MRARSNGLEQGRTVHGMRTPTILQELWSNISPVTLGGLGGDALPGVLHFYPNKQVCSGRFCILPDTAPLAATAHAVHVSCTDVSLPEYC